MPLLDDAIATLRQHFGFDDFREGQREVVGSILDGKDAVVVMPTGSGKSLCYQLPAMILDGVTLVVSPLIALMKDQVDALHARGLPATFINSSLSEQEQRARIDSLRRRAHKLVYIAPERFRSSRFTAAVQSIPVSLFAVDEAHCISTWGHDFRPDYLRLKHVIRSLGRIQTIALTATATPYVRSDIIQQLGLSNPQTFISGFDRPNLSIEVVHTEKEKEKISRIRHLAQKTNGSGIVYASTRKSVEQVGRELKVAGLRVSTYHAGMSDGVRIKAQEDFMSGRTQMIVATNAFGMGIDKPDIRFVAHYQIPGSIEAYYQEIGRAGRDGLPSTCVLLFNYADKNTHDFFIEGSYPDISTVKNVYGALLGTGQKRIELPTAQIGKLSREKNEMAVQSALYMLERAGHISREAPAVARSERGARNPRAIIMLDNVPVTDLRVDARQILGRADLERRKLRELINLCYTDYCYRAHILNYFGDRNHERQCGTCGNCRPKTAAPLHEITTDEPARSVVRNSEPRALTEDELLRIRKILACAKRMNGRFGKKILAATLRGSASKQVMSAGLNELSTYGLLKDMTNDEVQTYIDALADAGCLKVKGGAYPTISSTDLGDRVMREQEQITLALP
ncbi:MAG TPA: ATP-dependent DNA helicase RecQ [Pyrinomonadaceae bacterium]|jgi:ATP-dependent DNA helicase RecQ|nr:ATP-dependent DNA helicase RecQ [Pyrinomonadaceae bacterium]